jgi:pilus assembly protein CpaF
VTDRSIGDLEFEVRELVKTRGLDPSREGMEVLGPIVDEVLAGYERRLGSSTLPRLADRPTVRKQLIDNVGGYGPLQALLDDDDIEEIWINGPGRVFCARRGDQILTNLVLEDSQIGKIVERMLRASGRRLDTSSPFVDAMLTDGSRLHVVIPDITHRHWAVNIRKFVLKAGRLRDLVGLGTIGTRAAEFLDASVKAGLNLVVSGGTQAGKTTMLNCLAASIGPRERVITCEEVFELKIPLPDVVGMQTRQPNLEGRGGVDLRRLIVEALRMRPNRIIVGEVRQREALDLLIALNSGLPGMTSVHANSASEALRKLTTLPLMAGENVTHGFVVPTVARSIDLVVHLVHDKGQRRVTEVIGVTGRTEGEVIETVRLWESVGGRLQSTGHPPPAEEKFKAAGISVRELMR